jgi:hypothetical protein
MEDADTLILEPQYDKMVMPGTEAINHLLKIRWVMAIWQ